jgi:hypothetical protein
MIAALVEALSSVMNAITMHYLKTQSIMILLTERFVTAVWRQIGYIAAAATTFLPEVAVSSIATTALRMK